MKWQLALALLVCLVAATTVSVAYPEEPAEVTSDLDDAAELEEPSPAESQEVDEAADKPEGKFLWGRRRWRYRIRIRHRFRSGRVRYRYRYRYGYNGYGDRYSYGYGYGRPSSGYGHSFTYSYSYGHGR